VGRKDIDKQHKHIFNIANSLPESCDEALIKKNIMKLYKYTREHFKAEEQMMKEIGYPGIEEHRDLHEDLISQLNDISNQKFENDQSVVVFKQFVYDWVVNHILNHDNDYFRFTKKQQSGVKCK
jgi:hemerythrin-like metal-binding protein